MYTTLKNINSRPRPWEYFTAETLWTDPHIANRMLAFHLDDTTDAASRSPAFVRKSLDWIADRFTIESSTDIADFGCGPGLYTLPLAQTGANVTGIDFSSNSLSYARERAAVNGVDIDYVLCNYLGYKTAKKFDLVLMIWCDFCALSLAQQSVLLGKFRDMLKPGDSILLDVHTQVWYKEQQETASYEHNHMNGFWSPDDYYTFMNIFKYDIEELVLHKYTIIEETRTRSIYNWLQGFSRERLQQIFRKNGLEINEWYADVAGSPYDPAGHEMAIVANRK